MTIDLIHYNIKLRHNNIDSQHKKDFNSAEIDEILNDAILIWVEQQYSGNNHKQTSFETTQQRIDNLSSLVVKYPEQIFLTPNSINGNTFEFNLNKLKYKYLHPIRVEAKINKCSEKIEVKIVQHDDINKYMRDPLKKPSYKPFPRVIGNYGKQSNQLNNSSLYLYSYKTLSLLSVTFSIK